MKASMFISVEHALECIGGAWQGLEREDSRIWLQCSKSQTELTLICADIKERVRPANPDGLHMLRRCSNSMGKDRLYETRAL